MPGHPENVSPAVNRGAAGRLLEAGESLQGPKQARSHRDQARLHSVMHISASKFLDAMSVCIFEPGGETGVAALDSTLDPLPQGPVVLARD